MGKEDNFHSVGCKVERCQRRTVGGVFSENVNKQLQCTGNMVTFVGPQQFVRARPAVMHCGRIYNLRNGDELLIRRVWRKRDLSHPREVAQKCLGPAWCFAID